MEPAGAHRIRVQRPRVGVLENQLYVVTSPLVGTCGIPVDGAIHGTGTAFVASPIDRTFGFDDGVVIAHDGYHSVRGHGGRRSPARAGRPVAGGFSSSAWISAAP